jgi:hypothetical protein
MKPGDAPPELFCSFCGKRRADVKRLIAGLGRTQARAVVRYREARDPAKKRAAMGVIERLAQLPPRAVHICNECVTLCVEVFDDGAPLKGRQILVRLPDGTHRTCAPRSGWTTLVHESGTYEWCLAGGFVRGGVVIAVRERGVAGPCVGGDFPAGTKLTDEHARIAIEAGRPTRDTSPDIGRMAFPRPVETPTPDVPYAPTAEDRARAAAWRTEPTLAAAWRSYVSVATDERWERECGVYGFDRGSGDYDADRLELSAQEDSRVVLVCEKTVVRDAADTWDGAERPSAAHDAKAGLAWVRPLPSAWSARALHEHAKRLRVPLAFFGDLDPQALHFFAAIRAGGRDRALRGGSVRVPIRWVGLDGRWLDLMCEHLEIKDIPSHWTIKLNWLDQEYWQIVKRMVPDAKRLLGARGFALLERGEKIEADVFLSIMRQPFREELRRRLRRLSAAGRSARGR